MSNIDKIEIKLLSENAIVPTRAHPTDSGLDLYAPTDVVIPGLETVVIKTDIAINIPKGYEATVRPRSGLTSKTKLRVQLGTVDEAYTGNIGIIIDNNDVYNTVFNKGDRIAQLVITPVVTPEPVLVDSFDKVETRGDKGFGSTDKVNEDKRNSNEELILVPQAEYNSLLDNSAMLTALNNVGVDNWWGYEQALTEYEILTKDGVY